MKDLAEKLRFKSFNWAGPLSNLLVQDFKNISSFETLGPFRFYVDRKLTGNRIPTVKWKIPEKAFLKSESRTSVTKIVKNIKSVISYYNLLI